MKITHLLNSISPLIFSGILAASLSGADIVSVNIGGSIDPTRVLTDFGVPDYNSVAGNWNNVGFDTADLLFEDGTTSTVGLTVTFPWGKDDDNGNDRRFGAGNIGTPLHHGPNIYPATPEVSLSFFGLSSSFPDGYYVIVYLSGFANAEGVVTDGRTPYYFRTGADLSIPLTPETLIQTTTSADPGLGNYPVAHYAVYGSKDFAIRSDAYTIKMEASNRGVTLGGVQFVSATIPDGPAQWAGYELDENGNIDTGAGFLGWLNSASDSGWLYSYSARQFIYAEETLVDQGFGGWVYVTDQSLLDLEQVADAWYTSEVYGYWVFAPGSSVGTGAGWLYVYDLGTSD